MEILKPGQKPQGFADGGEVECSHCHCLFKYSSSDVHYSYDFIDLSVTQYYVKCPSCGSSVSSCSEFTVIMKEVGTLIGVVIFIAVVISPFLFFGYSVYWAVSILIK